MATRSEIEAIIKLRDEMSAKLKKIERSVGNLDRKFKRAKASNTGFASSLKKGAVQAVAFGGAAGIAAIATTKLVGALAAGVRGAIAFNKSMLRIETLVGVAREEVEAMKDSVRGIAAATGRGPTELAEAMFQITSATLRGDDALIALEASARGAALGLGEAKDVADAATSIINAYGVENINASEAVDVLLTTVRLGKGEAVEYASAFGNVIQVAESLGVSIQEVGTGMAVLTRTTGSANVASTQMAAIMRSIIKPTDKANAALEIIHVTMDDVRASIRERGLLVTLEDLNTRLGSKEIVNFAGRAEAINAVLGLTGGKFKQVAEAADDMNDAFGRGAEGIKRLEEDTSFRAEQMSTNFTNFLDAVGESFVTFLASSALGAVLLAKSVEQMKLDKLAEDAERSAAQLNALGLGAEAARDRTLAVAAATDGLAGSLFAAQFGASKFSIALGATLPEAITAGIESLNLADQALINHENAMFQAKLAVLALGQQETILGQESAAAAIKIGEAYLKMHEERRADEEATAAFIQEQNIATVAGALTVFGQLGSQFKALAIAGAIISTYSAIAKALGAYPWPFNLVAAAAAGAAGFANVAKIRSSSAGFQEGTPRLDFQDFGNERSVSVHGREAIIPRGGGHELAREIASSLPQSGAGGPTRSDMGGGINIESVTLIAGPRENPEEYAQRFIRMLRDNPRGRNEFDQRAKAVTS